MYAFSCHKVQCSRLQLLLHLELVYIHTNGVSGDIYACYVRAIWVRYFHTYYHDSFQIRIGRFLILAHSSKDCTIIQPYPWKNLTLCDNYYILYTCKALISIYLHTYIKLRHFILSILIDLMINKNCNYNIRRKYI